MTCERCKSIPESGYAGEVFSPPGGNYNYKTYRCPCGATYWQFNSHFHFWREVPPEAYEAARAGLDFVINGDVVEVGSPGQYF